jgi:glucose-1-phosphate thymidylyltransferase
MKGIVLAGGSGSRLFPLTQVTSKQLLPVFDKPTIYYPLSVLMLAGIREILFISTPRDLPRIKDLLGDGSHLGLRLEYIVQENPEGIAQAFLLGKDFVGNSPVALILGDNIFYGQNLSKMMQQASELSEGANVFAYHVNDPERYGIVTFDKSGKAVDIAEKPRNPKSHWAVTGLYFYDNQVLDIVKDQKPSPRGELEITDVNKVYLEKGLLKVTTLGRGYAWLDTGTDETLLEASHFIYTLEKRQGLKVACLEEIAYKMGYIDFTQLCKTIENYPDSGYGRYLKTYAAQLSQENN